MKHYPFFSFLLVVFSLIQNGCNWPGVNQTQYVDVTDTNRHVTIPSMDTSSINKTVNDALAVKNEHPDSAKNLLSTAATASILKNYHEGTARAYINLGLIYSDHVVYDSSMYYYQQALFHSFKIHPKKGISSVVYAAMGQLYYRKSRFDTSALYLYKALIGLNRVQSSNCKNLYFVYHSVGSFWANHNIENAHPYLDLAEKLATLHGDPTIISRSRCTRAVILCKGGYLDSARQLFTKVLNDPASDKLTQYYANFNMGTIYLQPDTEFEARKSIPFLAEALRISKDMNSKFEMLQAKAHLGNAYILTGQYNKAEPLLLSVLNNAEDVGLGQNFANINANLGEMYNAQGRQREAYAHVKKALNLQKKLLSAGKTETINKLEIKYRTAEKDKLLTANKLKIAQQDNLIQKQLLWIVGGASVALLLISMLFFKMKIRKQKNKLAQLKATIEGEEKERTRLARDLHDGIVSRLSAIKMNFSALPLKYPAFEDAREDYQKIIAQLEQSIAELRTTSHNLLPDILHQAGLAEAVHIYSSKISQLSQLDIEFIMIGDLPPLKQDFQLTVYRIIQELINNIIKHANATHTLIQFQVVEDLLNITVDDNGDGLPFSLASPGQGIGLQNLKNRVNTLNGTIEIESHKGTSVYLTFHLDPFIDEVAQDRSQAISQ